MWVKKREWEEMKRQIEIQKNNHSYVINQLDFLRYTSANRLKESADTAAIKGVTFSELAKYVLDGEPIKRKQEVEVVFRNENYN